ncbi:MAG: peptidylprolyl isomerase [Myxococcota bacterium]|jgi:FKBP-type peptidyl-prolyl cis-trans isomerase SlyD|nr:peptidylprolyl isomerase [Myxococcota bacterium]
MKIAEGKFVSIEYTLKLDSAEVVDASEPGEPLGFVCGSGQIIAGLEQQLEGRQVGESFTAAVEAADGYGERDEGLIEEIPRKNFPADVDIQAGMTFTARGHGGPVSFNVVSVDDEKVVADFNHSLAGKRLHFNVKIIEVREPTAEELEAMQEDHSCCEHTCSGCGAH